MRLTRTLKEFFQKGDVLLLVLCVVASLMGLVLIYSATQWSEKLQNSAMKQAFCARTRRKNAGILCVFQIFATKLWRKMTARRRRRYCAVLP